MPWTRVLQHAVSALAIFLSTSARAQAKDCLNWQIPPNRQNVEAVVDPHVANSPTMKLGANAKVCVRANLETIGSVDWLQVRLTPGGERWIRRTELLPENTDKDLIPPDPRPADLAPQVFYPLYARPDRRCVHSAASCLPDESCEQGFCTRQGFRTEKANACKYLKETAGPEWASVLDSLCLSKPVKCKERTTAEECARDPVDCAPKLGSSSGPGCKICAPEKVFWSCGAREPFEVIRIVLNYQFCKMDKAQWTPTSANEHWKCECPADATGQPQEFIPMQGCRRAHPGFSAKDGNYRCSPREVYTEGRGCLTREQICKERMGEWIEMPSSVSTTEYLPLAECKQKIAARWEESPYPPVGRCRDKNFISRLIQRGTPDWICDSIQRQELNKVGKLESFIPILDPVVLCTYQPKYRNEPRLDYKHQTRFGTPEIDHSFCRVNGHGVNI